MCTYIEFLALIVCFGCALLLLLGFDLSFGWLVYLVASFVCLVFLLLIFCCFPNDYYVGLFVVFDGWFNDWLDVGMVLVLFLLSLLLPCYFVFVCGVVMRFILFTCVCVFVLSFLTWLLDLFCVLFAASGI